MEKILLILVHPDLKKSKINQMLKNKIEEHKDKILIHNLYERYPDFHIDVAEEQRLLEEHDTIIIQFPFYWYSSPPLLKKWLDDVLEYNWAYGDDETAVYKLKDKKIGLAVTVGGPGEEYKREGLVSYTMDELLSPFIATIKYVGALYYGKFVLFDAVPETEKELIEAETEKYMEYILRDRL